MKKRIYIIISILLIFISLLKITPSFNSDKTLYYDASNKKFIYYNINSKDMYDNFKGLMPGDEKEQSLKIKIINRKENTKLYLKINYTENIDINNNLDINILKNNEEVIKNNDMFKIIDSNEDEVNLKINIKIPTSLGNEIKEYNKNFRMTFYIEENNDMIEVPYTYDNILKYYLLLIISIILLALTIIFLKKEKKKEKYNTK